MTQKKNALSLFGKIALLTTTFLAVAMVGGGIFFFEGHANSFFSKFAGLFMSYAGGWMFISCVSKAKNIVVDIVYTSKDIIISLIKHLIRALAM